DLITDSGRTAINSFIASFLEEFADKYGVYLRRINSSRHYFFCDYRILEKMINDKFSVLKEFRELSSQKEIPLTLSV
ncbi:DHH family phosphoesterase, partial [Bacillus cereus]